MAEGIARSLIAERGIPNLEAMSAGSFANVGSPASEGSLVVARENGIDLSEHWAQLLTPELVQSADLVLVMGPHHLERAEELGGEGKTHLLSAYASRGESSRPVNDPFGGEVSVYRETFHELSHEIGNALDRIVSDRTTART